MTPHSLRVAQLQADDRIKRGWKVWAVTPTNELRYVHRGSMLVLQQACVVRWRHDREQHVGGGYYSHDEDTSEWLDVPIVDA